MGGGQSVNANLTPAQQGEVARKISEEYEKLKAASVADGEVQVAMQKLYLELLSSSADANEVKTTRITTVVSGAIPTGALNRRGTGVVKNANGPLATRKTGIAADSIMDGGDDEEEEEEAEETEKAPAVVVKSTPPPAVAASPAKATAVAASPAKATAGPPGKAGKAAGGGKAPTRRRSFEPAASAGTSVSATLIVSQSDATLPTASLAAASAPAAEQSELPKDKDHWDSVSQLPYCNVCQMAFKSEGLLDRHIKYSDLHERTVKKKEAEALKASEPQTAFTPDDNTATLALQQLEGRDFKHLYYGSKFFWRTQDNVDFTFFHHLLLDTIEVVSFSVYKNMELPRMYLSLYSINSKLEAAGLLAKPDSDLRFKAAKDRHKNELDVDESNRNAITTFVLSRLQLETKPTGEQLVIFQPTGSDDVTSTPCLAEKPSLLIPRPVVHRRNSSTDEMNRKLEDLRADQALLSAATNRAEKIGSFVVSFAASFKNSSRRLAAMSATRRRWAVAIQRVLQINGVKRTHKFLEDLEIRKQPTSESSRRVRSNTNPDA